MLNNMSKMTPGLPYDWLVWEVCYVRWKHHFALLSLCSLYNLIFFRQPEMVFLHAGRKRTPVLTAEVKLSQWFSSTATHKTLGVAWGHSLYEPLMLWCVTEVRHFDFRQQRLLMAPDFVSTTWWLNYDTALAWHGWRLLRPVLTGQW